MADLVAGHARAASLHPTNGDDIQSDDERLAQEASQTLTLIGHRGNHHVEHRLCDDGLKAAH